MQRSAAPGQSDGDGLRGRFRAIFHVAYPALGRYVHNRGFWGADADDLVAETLEIAWRRLDQVPEDDPLPWLFAVARNLLRNKRRSEGRRALLLARLAGERADAHAGESATSQEAVLLGALASLRPDDQEILKLVAWDGLSPSQAAVVLGCSPLAARTRLHRARNRLAKRLGFERGVQRSSMARQILQSKGDVCPVPEVTDG